MSIKCDILNPHYKDLLEVIGNFSKSKRTLKYFKNPYEAAFRIAERDFLVDYETLKYDTNKEILTKGRLNKFKKSLDNLNDRVEKGTLDANWAQTFYQTSHYGTKDPIIGSYLKEMQNSSFFFRKNELRDKTKFKEVINFLKEDMGINGLIGNLGYFGAQRKLKKLDNDLVEAINNKNDSKVSEVQSEIDNIMKKGSLKSFGDFLYIIEKSLPDAVRAKYELIKRKAEKGDNLSKKQLEKINKKEMRLLLTSSEIRNAVRDKEGNLLLDRPGMYKAVVKYDDMMEGLYKTLRNGMDKTIDSMIERMKINGDIETSNQLKNIKNRLEETYMPKYEGQTYFPHYVRDLSAPFMNKLMPHLDDLQTSVNPYIKNKTKTTKDVVNEINQMIDKHAKGRYTEGEYNYSKNFLNVVGNYITDVNRFNFKSYVDSHLIKSMHAIENIYKTDKNVKGYADNVVTFIEDLHKAANGDNDLSPRMRSLSRSILGFEFISKIGINPRSAVRNFTQRLLDYVEWGPVQIKKMKEQINNITFKNKDGKIVGSEVFIESALKADGMLYDEASQEVLESGLQSPASMFNLRRWNENTGKYEIIKKGSLDDFADFTSTLAAKSSFIHRKAENSNRKHTYKLAFSQLYNWLSENPSYAQSLSEKGYDAARIDATIMKKARNYAKNMVILNHFDYADYAKSKMMRSNIGRFLFQFQHYSMEFFERNVRILKEAKEDVLAGKLMPGGDARGIEKAYRMGVAYFLAPVMAAAITGLNFENLVQHDTAQRINQWMTLFTGDEEEVKKAFYGKGPVLSTVGGPFLSDLVDLGIMFDVVNLDEDSLFTIATGIQEYDIDSNSTDLSKKIRFLNSFAGRLIERHIPQLNKGRIGWAVQQELGLYPTKEAKEVQKTYKQIRKRTLPLSIENSLRKLEEGQLV